MIDFTTIKLIIWDLDETLWQGTLSDNDTVSLRSNLVQLINDSLDRGIVHSICSKNDFETAKKQLLSMNLWNLFVFPSINWDSKGIRIKATIEQMKLRAPNVLFVDDNTSNLQEATYYSPELQVCTPQELIESIDAIFEITKIDATRPRLSQYRLMEEKNCAEKAFTSNEDFLMSCNIHVNFHADCKENIDRIHDLIMRSNQLNYTKFRQEKESLLLDLSSPNTDATYITVKDSFGDYGIVGFYMSVNHEVKHYLFSCRILGMLVEQYVYMKLGCPEISVVGDVITQLNTTDIPDWINRDCLASDSQQVESAIVAQKVLFKGPCDISQIFSFIKETTDITSEFAYVNDNGIFVEGYNHTSQMVTALTSSREDKLKLLNDTCWIDEKMLDSASWQSHDVIVFSMLTDGNLGVYEHKETGLRIALCEEYYDLTDESNWDGYINNRIFTSFIKFNKEDLIHFANKFKRVDNADGEVSIKNLDILYKYKKKDAILIILLGSEKAFEGETGPSYFNRHNFHKVLNDKIRIWSANKTDVCLIEIGKYIHSQKDYLDTINHFQKRIYYHIAQDLLKIINYNHSRFEIKRKTFMYWETIMVKLRLIKRAFSQKILKR